MISVGFNLDIKKKKKKWDVGGVTPPTLKIYHFARQKRQYSVFLQGNVLDPSQLSEHILTI